MRTVRMLWAVLVALIAMAVGAGTAAADSGDCGSPGCVMLIEVDGLEPEDVSQTSTPFLWALAHPDPAAGPAGPVYDRLFDGRNGFMWQAGRSPMTASTATSTASLLTGANPDQHGLLADEFIGPGATPGSVERQRLRPASAGDAGGGELPAAKLGIDTLLTLAVNSADAFEPEVWAFIGNPAVAQLVDSQLQVDGVRAWSPTAQTGSDPALCPLPRATPETDEDAGADEAEGLGQRDCPAPDAKTLQEAFSTFNDDADHKTPILTYIHLAELGRMKQLHGDAEVAKTLEEVDGALAAFVEGLATSPNTSSGFGATTILVTGNHGYEPTPIDQRVPDPKHAGDDTYDFSDFLRDALPGEARQTVLVPQGTFGTVYAPEDATPDELAALATLIEEKGDEACGEDCIAEVAPVTTLADLHETWSLNPLTGAGGDLVVTLAPGWAFGRAQERREPGGPLQAEATNPYPGSAGGPRNRGIAVLLNGPDATAGNLDHTIRQVRGDWMPVKPGADTAPACTASGTVEEPNDPAAMADDAAAPGHECQPETVDIALTIAGILKLDTGTVPIAPHARLLNEAFTPALGPEIEVEEPQPPPPVVEPPPPPPPIIIQRGSVQVIPPPPPRDPFPYRGLVRRIRVGVTDALGKTFRQARRGATLSTIQVQADFGKPESLVTLTFYRRKGRKLRAVARFKPFAVKRGPVRLRLRIPSQFHPTHLGVFVREVRDMGGGVKKPVGRPGGGVAQITDARLLHQRKGARRL